MAVSRRLRFEVLRRDGHTCRYCGASAPDVALTVDHVIPVALGGGDEPGNLVTACSDCNAGKTSMSPDEPTVAAVEADAERWAAAVSRAAELRRAENTARDDHGFLSAFYAEWRDRTGSDWDMADERWESTVLRFRDLGLNLSDQHACIAAMARNLGNIRRPFRYFCSLCWAEIEARTELAEHLIREEN